MAEKRHEMLIIDRACPPDQVHYRSPEPDPKNGKGCGRLCQHPAGLWCQCECHARKRG